MVDVRRALPATPIAVWSGLLGATLGLGRNPTPWMPAIAGSAALVTAFMLTYRLMASWTDRARRTTGYVAVVALALVVGAVLGLVALLVSMCWRPPSQCPDDAILLALALGTLIVPVLLVGLYAAADYRSAHLLEQACP